MTILSTETSEMPPALVPEGDSPGEDDDEQENSSQEHSDDSSGAVVVKSAQSRNIIISKKSSRLQILLQKFDQFLQDYVNFTSSAGNQERSLKLLQWTLWLASYLKKSQGLKKLYANVSWARYLLRLFGGPASLEAARTGSWGRSSSPKNATALSRLGNLMAYSMLAYYPYEHAAYLGWMAPSVFSFQTKSGEQTANRWSAISCRFWLVYLIAEMAQSTLVLQELLQERRRQQHETENDKEVITEQEGLDHSIRNQQLQLVRSLLFTLPCIHWSLPRWASDPWLPESAVNGLCWVESLVSMYQSIYNYKRQ